MFDASAAIGAIVPIVVAVVAATIGWWQWCAKRRVEQVGFYVNPFLVAAEELQSRLFNILANNGLEPLQARMSADDLATETLYLAARYFGWERVLYRRGPYTNDAGFIRLTRGLRKQVATSALEIGAYCFFRTEQADLGRLVVQETGDGPYITELPMFEFRGALQASGLDKRVSIAAALEAFDSWELDGNTRARLTGIQACLVDILNHIESRERVSISGEERRKQVPSRVITTPVSARAA